MRTRSEQSSWIVEGHWIAFHVPQHGIKVIVLFNRKRFETALVRYSR